MSKGFAIFVRFFGCGAAVLGFLATEFTQGETADSPLFLLPPVVWGIAIVVLSFACANLIDRMLDREEELKRLKEKLDQ